MQSSKFIKSSILLLLIPVYIILFIVMDKYKNEKALQKEEQGNL